jgi:hypothetical protein
MFVMCLNKLHVLIKLLTNPIKALEQLHHQKCIWCIGVEEEGQALLATTVGREEE